MRHYTYLCFVILFTQFFSLSHADKKEFFDSDSVVPIIVEAPISRLTRQRGPDPEDMQGFIHYTDESGSKVTFDVELRARGDFRRDQDSCSFPPFMVNFKKSQVQDTVFAGLDKVKVVSHCRGRPESFKDYIYKEYLAYKTYNILTESSFRVRLLSVHYVEPGKEPSGDPKVAFMIESIESLAERHDGSEIATVYALPSGFIPESLALFGLFEYFIGNTDFSVIHGEGECCHNTKVIQTRDGLIPVPYDFDITGIVDVPYAVVNPRVPIKSVKDRYFRGISTNDVALEHSLKRFSDNREAIVRLWSEDPFLSEWERESCVKYIGEFYEVIDDPDRLQKEIISKMRDAEKLESVLLKNYGN